MTTITGTDLEDDEDDNTDDDDNNNLMMIVTMMMIISRHLYNFFDHTHPKPKKEALH